MAMLSFSFKFRPRTIAGAAMIPTAELATTRPNWRRDGRPDVDVEEKDVSLMGIGSWVDTFDRSIRLSDFGAIIHPFVSFRMDRAAVGCNPGVAGASRLRPSRSVSIESLICLVPG